MLSIVTNLAMRALLALKDRWKYCWAAATLGNQIYCTVHVLMLPQQIARLRMLTASGKKMLIIVLQTADGTKVTEQA